MNGTLFLPDGYEPKLDVAETERAIRLVKSFFQTNLAFELNLIRVTAPLFVEAGTGINDDLNGVERPVSFEVPALGGVRAEIVQSLAKWKRMALADLGLKPGEGIYTDMNAIRPDETLDNLHSLYVDQWDWERVITEEERSLAFLKRIVRRIYSVISRTERYVCHHYPQIERLLPEEITFVHAEELEAEFPSLAPREREAEACRRHGAVFIIGIGGGLRSGEPHDGRAPDYDDWITPTGGGHRGLNGDIVVDYPLLRSTLELSSMGIRVDAASLAEQLRIRGAEERRSLLFHRRLLAGDLPLSMGGGIGQSRLCMLFLRKAHIGEIQASLWSDEVRRTCRGKNVFLL
ncbi:MAG: aspartate--ammonia ligase [Planctomycetes bacterium]|nr:aspartate--ammonia ligase [Planctomycetota bacterium]